MQTTLHSQYAVTIRWSWSQLAGNQSGDIPLGVDWPHGLGLSVIRTRFSLKHQASTPPTTQLPHPSSAIRKYSLFRDRPLFQIAIPYRRLEDVGAAQVRRLQCCCTPSSNWGCGSLGHDIRGLERIQGPHVDSEAEGSRYRMYLRVPRFYHTV